MNLLKPFNIIFFIHNLPGRATEVSEVERSVWWASVSVPRHDDLSILRNTTGCICLYYHDLEGKRRNF